jgi:leukotriene-A4 hydrolase
MLTLLSLFPDVFKVFFKDYIQMNKLKSIDTKEFVRIFKEYFTKEGKADLIKDVDWDTWLYAPGLPPPALYTPK